MFEKTVKQSLSQSPEGTRRQTTRSYSVYSVLLVLTRGRHLSLCQHHIGWILQIFPTPSHLVMTPFEFMEKLYSSWN